MWLFCFKYSECRYLLLRKDVEMQSVFVSQFTAEKSVFLPVRNAQFYHRGAQETSGAF